MTAKELDDSLLITALKTLLDSGETVLYQSMFNGSRKLEQPSKVFIDSLYPKYSGLAWHINVAGSVGFTILPMEEDKWLLTPVGDVWYLHKEPLKLKEEVQTPLIFDILSDACREAEDNHEALYPNIELKAKPFINIQQHALVVKAFMGYITSVGIRKSGIYKDNPLLVIFCLPDTPIVKDGERVTIQLPLNKADELLTLTDTPAGLVVKNA